MGNTRQWTTKFNANNEELRRTLAADLCSVEGCHRLTKVRGMCGAHYQRLMKHGSATSGGPLSTPRGSALLFLSSILWTTEEECISWPFSVTTDGYGRVKFDGRMTTASRAICEMSNGKPPTPDHEAAHSCGNGHNGCVNPRHLSWKTPKENADDKREHGTHLLGERVGTARLSEQNVRDIWRLSWTMSLSAIARMFGVHRGTIKDILNGRNWGWLSHPEGCTSMSKRKQAVEKAATMPLSRSLGRKEETR